VSSTGLQLLKSIRTSQVARPSFFEPPSDDERRPATASATVFACCHVADRLARPGPSPSRAEITVGVDLHLDAAVLKMPSVTP